MLPMFTNKDKQDLLSQAAAYKAICSEINDFDMVPPLLFSHISNLSFYLVNYRLLETSRLPDYSNRGLG